MSQSFELKIDWATHEASKFAVENWHYSQSMPAGKTVKIGVWENQKYVGVLLFSRGANNKIGSPFGLEQTEICELTRIALRNHTTQVTRIISIALKFLKKSSPKLRLIVSYADPEHGHHGGVYQGAGWVYAGMTNPADEYLVQGKRMHGRSMRAAFGTHIGKDFIKIISWSSKHRYLMPLDEAMRIQIEPLRKSYPKRAGSKDSVASDSQLEEGGSTPTPALQGVING